MRSGFAPIIVLLVVLFASLASFTYLKFKNQSSTLSPLAQSSAPYPDAYPGWKTYQNKTHDFSIRYPKQWFVKEYGDYAADFISTGPQKEASPAAIKVRYLHLTEKVDLDNFEKIYNSKEQEEIYEPLDVKSIITKIRNLEIGGNSEVEYEINRNFSALEGPKTEYSHVYEIKKGDAILKFIASGETKEHEQQIDPIFVRMIKSLKF